MRRCFAVFVLLLAMGSALWAADDFKINNPDIKKYEFARSYITALSYLKHLDERWNKKSPKKIHAGDDTKVISLSIDYLTLDNADLRIAKNYMIPYLSAKNNLVRKVADTFIESCNEQIAIKDKDKIAWQQWAYLKDNGQATVGNEKAFIFSHRQYGSRLKEAEKKTIQATILMSKVLISDQNSNEKGHILAITAKERDKLLEKLDSFGKNVLSWGLKPGLRTIEASIAVIREVLEDSVWIPLDEK